jgi:ribosomal-protein-alanine N-acetyltransferase
MSLLRQTFIDGARIEEAGVLSAIHAEAFRRTWSAHEFTALLADPAVFALTLRVAPLFGARHVAGFALVRFAADEAEILSIAVSPGERRRGYGRMLMEDVIRRLYRERIAALFLEVDRANAAAVGLYRSLGFVVASERRNYYDGGGGGGDGTALVMRLQVR